MVGGEMGIEWVRNSCGIAAQVRTAVLGQCPFRCPATLMKKNIGEQCEVNFLCSERKKKVKSL